MESLPPHTIRESARARRVLLRFSHSAGLEIVVPRGFRIRPAEVEDLLVRHSDWILRASRRFRAGPQRGFARVPRKIELRAVGRLLTVRLNPEGASKSVRLQWTETSEGEVVTLSGATGDAELIRGLLLRFLRQQAVSALPEFLGRVARRTGLSFRGVSVRVQKTRWGSYSSRGTVSLNAKLLFLPPQLVEYVMLHELCHSRHLNHGAEFRALVSSFEPQAEQREAELREWERRLPPWTRA